MREFIRPAIRALPASMARRMGPCQITLVEDLAPDVASQWTASARSLEVTLAIAGVEHHDAALEMLVCLGQALWERLSDAEQDAYWGLLRDEIQAGIEGEIDEAALQSKRSAGSPARLRRYGQDSFAGTAAEYVHSLWHEVTIRTGPDHLPPAPLRRRLELLALWFPPNRGYRLFPARHHTGSGPPGSQILK